MWNIFTASRTYSERESREWIGLRFRDYLKSQNSCLLYGLFEAFSGDQSHKRCHSGVCVPRVPGHIKSHKLFQCVLVCFINELYYVAWCRIRNVCASNNTIFMADFPFKALMSNVTSYECDVTFVVRCLNQYNSLKFDG